MDHIRLIASDMDATLLDERSQLPPDFAETIRALAGQGILFAAASGRPLYTLETMFPELLEEIILIGDNGGAARWKGKDLFVSEMPAEGWRQLARSTKQAGDVGLLCGLQAAYAEKRDERYDAVGQNALGHPTVPHFALFLLDILPKYLYHMQCRRALLIIECKEIFA